MGKIDTQSPARAKWDVLPSSLAPLALKREEAAAFIRVSPSKFDEMVDDGRMPKPKRIDGSTVWPVRKLVLAFEALPDDAGSKKNPWDETCGLS